MIPPDAAWYSLIQPDLNLNKCSYCLLQTSQEVLSVEAKWKDRLNQFYILLQTFYSRAESKHTSMNHFSKNFDWSNMQNDFTLSHTLTSQLLSPFPSYFCEFLKEPVPVFLHNFSTWYLLGKSYKVKLFQMSMILLDLKNDEFPSDDTIFPSLEKYSTKKVTRCAKVSCRSCSSQNIFKKEK